jgi:hypothetical protein
MCLTANATLDRGASIDHLPAGAMLAALTESIADIQKPPALLTIRAEQARPQGAPAHRRTTPVVGP